MLNQVKFREGAFLEIADGSIFEVKGVIHPPGRIISLPRYLPDPEGDRIKNLVCYRKVYSFKERLKILENRYSNYMVYDPVYNRHLCEVDVRDVVHLYDPREYLEELRSSCSSLDTFERLAIQLADTLISESGADPDSIGVSGSILVDLQNPDSDLDLIVYGGENCRLVREGLLQLLQKEKAGVRRYDIEELHRLYQFRVKDTKMDFEEFVRHEVRKSFQGIFMKKNFFIRYVRESWELKERYGDVVYHPIGYGVIKGRVADDSEAIFTPCCYIVEDVIPLDEDLPKDILRVTSFRGRFCEQVFKDERFIARGRIERVSKGEKHYHQMILGERDTDTLLLQQP